MSNEKKYQSITLLNSLLGFVIMATLVVAVLSVMFGSLSFFAKASF